MKKKILSFLLGGLLMLSMFSGCNQNDNKGSNNGGNTNTSQLKYDYSITDIVKTDIPIDVESIVKKAPNVEKIGVINDFEGIMITGENYKGTPNKSYAIVGKPTTDMPKDGFPAVLLIHGGGGHANPDWVEYWVNKGFVALAIDIDGHMYDEYEDYLVNKEYKVDGAWGSITCGTTESEAKNSWTFQNIAFCMHANNYLRSLDYVNKDKIVVNGVSWGGYMTCVLSGIDKRFQAFAPIFGCGSLDTDTWALYTQNMISLGDKLDDWKAVYDPTSYLPYATKPMLFTNGATDHAFSMYSQYTSTSLVPGKVFYSYRSSLYHSDTNGTWSQAETVYEFFMHVLNDTQMQANILKSSLNNDKNTLNIEIESIEQLLDNGALIYSTDTSSDTHTWKWKTLEVEITENKLSVDLPSDATAVFFEIYGEDEKTRISTNIYFLKDIQGLC